jgi:hypothetical protein
LSALIVALACVVHICLNPPSWRVVCTALSPGQTVRLNQNVINRRVVGSACFSVDHDRRPTEITGVIGTTFGDQAQRSINPADHPVIEAGGNVRA